MSKNTPNDPGEAFRELVTQWERGFNSLANRIMGTEEFSRTMNQAQNAQLGAQKAFREFMNQNLTMANMPTRDDMVRVAETVAQLDKRMARIEALLEAMRPSSEEKQPAGRKGPPRTKRPPSASAGTPPLSDQDAPR
jgi:hypothetical protein